MQTHSIPRRQLLRLVGAGALLGAVGTASASEGRYIVGTRSRAARREAQRRARSVRHVLDFGAYGSAVAGTFPEEALRGLARRPDVDYIEEDGLMYAISITPNATGELADSWGVDRIDAEQVHGTHAGVGAKIAILDTGIDYNHPDLAGNYAGGVTYVDGTSDELDDHGHGTHCAGIAAATGGDGGVVGTAPGASLYGVKVLAADGSGSYSDIAAGLNWARDNGMHVASMSLGGGSGTTTLQRACDSARDADVFVVAAAGNDGRGRLSYPAAYDSVVAVSATDRNDQLAWFSNTGNGLDHAAPGVEITSTYPGGGYATWNGTSMACPHVAGAAALVMADGTTGTDARARLAATAEDLGQRDYDKSYYGYGLVDAEAAVGGSSGGDDGGSTEDTTAPAAPSDLTTTTVDESTIDLAWTASSDDSGIDHYDVYVDVGGTWDPVGSTTTTDYRVSGLSAETTYTFGVSATDGAGNESDKSTVSETTAPASSGGDGTPPSGSVGTITESPSRNPHAEFDVPWSASDGDGSGLASVELVLTDDTGGGVEETVTVGLSGEGGAAGTVRMKAHKDDGSGHSYTVSMTVTDLAGNSADGTPGSVTES